MKQLINKIQQFMSNVADFINPQRVRHQNFCRWVDDAARAIADEDFYGRWRDAEPTLWKGESDED